VTGEKKTGSRNRSKVEANSRTRLKDACGFLRRSVKRAMGGRVLSEKEGRGTSSCRKGKGNEEMRESAFCAVDDRSFSYPQREGRGARFRKSKGRKRYKKYKSCPFRRQFSWFHSTRSILKEKGRKKRLRRVPPWLGGGERSVESKVGGMGERTC